VWPQGSGVVQTANSPGGTVIQSGRDTIIGGDQNAGLSPATFGEKSEFVTISLGTISVQLPSSTLETGATVEPFTFDAYKPIKFYMDHGKLFADITVYGGQGQPPIEVRHNTLNVRSTGSFDRNFDSSALEVVDSDRSPVLQLIYRTPYRIAVNGIFPIPDGRIIIASEDGTMIGAPRVPKALAIRRLFKYPAFEFLGKHDDSQVPPGPRLKQRAMEFTRALRQFVAKRISVQEQNRQDMRSALNETFLLYQDNFATKCIQIASEFRSSGLDMDGLPSKCKGAVNHYVMSEVADAVQSLANQLP
jgi:hypothetical protein